MTRNTVLRTLGLVVVGLLATAAVSTAIKNARRQHESVERGRALFNGARELVGRIPGQSQVLPTAATRCANCHAAGGGAAGKQDSAAAPGYAVSLSRALLSELRSRRGGPASRFNEHSMCALVRSGVDPAYIMIPQAMPHYDATDQDCSYIWDYLQTL